MTINQLSNGNPDGTVLGQSATDKVGVYGVPPVVQRSGAVQAALIDNSGGTATDTLAAISAGYVQAEVRNSIATLAAKINELRAALVAYGTIKGGA